MPKIYSPKVQFSSFTQSCPTLCNPIDCRTPGFPVHHQLLELAQTHVHQLVMLSNHLILSHPLLLLPSIFPSIRVFLNQFFTSGGQNIPQKAEAILCVCVGEGCISTVFICLRILSLLVIFLSLLFLLSISNTPCFRGIAPLSLSYMIF